MQPEAIPVPEGWQVSGLTLHYEKDAVDTGVPFAANIQVNLRMDAQENDSVEDLRARDQDELEAGMPGWKLLGAGKLVGGKRDFEFIEYTYADDTAEFQQLVLYTERGGHLYSVVGTHLSGDRFTTVRDQIISAAKSFSD